MRFYYINLNKHNERNQNMLLFFNNLSKVIGNINFQRIDGFDATNENIDDYIKLFKFENLNAGYYFKNDIYKFNKFYSRNKVVFEKPLKKGEFGCLYSHIKAIYEFSKTDDEYAFICEDDLDKNIRYENNYLKDKINYLISELDKYGIISLSCVGQNEIIEYLINNNKFKKNLFKFEPYTFYGTACYLINKKTAQKIINSCVLFEDNLMKLTFQTTKIGLVADNYIYSFANTHIYLPSLFFIRENNDSIINNDTNKQNISQQIMINYLENNSILLELEPSPKKNIIKKENSKNRKVVECKLLLRLVSK